MGSARNEERASRMHRSAALCGCVVGSGSMAGVVYVCVRYAETEGWEGKQHCEGFAARGTRGAAAPSHIQPPPPVAMQRRAGRGCGSPMAEEHGRRKAIKEISE